MSKQRNDGGPAFPNLAHWSDDRLGYVASGMTLRDYFAGQALQGQIAAFADEVARDASLANAEEAGISPKERVAQAAYEYADSMLKAREA